MRTRISALALGLVLMINVPAGNAEQVDYAKLVEQSFDNVDWDFEQRFAFTETSMSEDTHTVARFDPSKPEGDRWTLLSYDNRPPSVEEIEWFDDEHEFDQSHHSENGDDGVLELINLDTLELQEETADYWLFSFKPNFDGEDKEDRKFFRHMAGEIRISRQSGDVESMDIRNRKPIRPIIGAKIKSLVMQFEFAPAVEDGPVVLTHVTAGAKGSAFVMVRFNETETFSFSDFEYVGDQVTTED